MSFRRIFALITAAAMLWAVFPGCSAGGGPEESDSPAPPIIDTPAPTPEPTPQPTPEPEPLTAGFEGGFSGNFNPAYAQSENDLAVVSAVCAYLLNYDAGGNIVADGAAVSVETEPETGLTSYTFNLRDDLLLPDGRPLTADDLIFTLYLLCDSSYDGPLSTGTLPILGLEEYRENTAAENHEKYSLLFRSILYAGRDNADFSQWTYETQEVFWQIIDRAWREDVSAIIDYCTENFAAAYGESWFGRTAEEIKADRGLQTAFAMMLWGFGDLDENGGFYTVALGKTWTLQEGDMPSDEDFFNEAYSFYKGDPEAYWEVEYADGSSVVDAALPQFIGAAAQLDGLPPISGISGIERLSDYSVSVTVSGASSGDLEKFIIPVMPLSYYGGEYDYEKGLFGVTRGELHEIKAVTEPFGAGAYELLSFDGCTAELTANENYFGGEPATQKAVFTVTYGAQADIESGYLDIAQISGLSGGNAWDDGYCYLGINADNVCVSRDPYSEESLALRRGLIAAAAACRQDGQDWPLTLSSPCYPQISGGFETDMSAAVTEAKNCFAAASYTWDDALGKFTEAPDGARLEYDILVSSLDNPACELLRPAQEALSALGITLNFVSAGSESEFWSALKSGKQYLWCAGWSAETDIAGALFEKYSSSGQGNYYGLASDELDAAIGRTASCGAGELPDAVFGVLSSVKDAAVELPVYTRYGSVICGENVSGIPQCSACYSWIREIQNITVE